jgi:hypothetical protein
LHSADEHIKANSRDEARELAEARVNEETHTHTALNKKQSTIVDTETIANTLDTLGGDVHVFDDKVVSYGDDGWNVEVTPNDDGSITVTSEHEVRSDTGDMDIEDGDSVDVDSIKDLPDALNGLYPSDKSDRAGKPSDGNTASGNHVASHDTKETFDDRMGVYNEALFEAASQGWSADGLKNGDEAFRLETGVYISEDDFNRIIPDEHDRIKYLMWSNGYSDSNPDIINMNDDETLNQASDDMFNSDMADNAYFTEIDDYDFENPDDQ